MACDQFVSKNAYLVGNAGTSHTPMLWPTPLFQIVAPLG